MMIFFLMGLLRWRCFSFGLVLVLVLLGIFDGLGFKSAAWVSNRWLGYFWVFSTFFWVEHRSFSGYFRRPGFQISSVGLLIDGLGGGSCGHCWLQLV